MMRNLLREFAITSLFFIGTLYLYVILSYRGLEEYIVEGVLKDYMSSDLWHIEVFLAGIFLAGLFVLINRVTENRTLRKKSFGFIILFKSGSYLAAIFIVIILIYYIFTLLGLTTVEQMEIYKGLGATGFIVSFLVYILLVILILNFLHFVNRKLGPGTLFDLLMGKYHKPRNEELVFLFLDLKGSTSLAEKMGHKKYSSFLRESMHELSPFIRKYRARVYQYVGDEVVLYWNKKIGFSQMNCLKIFFEFEKSLKRREQHFINKYGSAPKYKAGMDVGIVTATEIGDIKREIAFHGDVLNTAARLEKKCNSYNSNLIVSEHVAELIQEDAGYFFSFLDDMPLEGKQEKLGFYSVSRES